MAVVVAEYIFSGISGSTIADVSAIGATMIPPMTRAGYKPEQAVSIVAAASAMGILVPPCILMIVIGAIANVSVAALFVGGFLPAVVLALAIMAYIYYDASRGGMAPPQPISWHELRESFVHALIPLGLPAIIFGGILGGIVTPTEAAAVAVLYAGVVGLVGLQGDQMVRPAAHPDRQRGDHGERLLPARRGGCCRLDAGGRAGARRRCSAQ